jgi:pectate lyase
MTWRYRFFVSSLMSRGLELYLASEKREKVRFCFILHHLDLRDRKAEIDRLTALFKESTYQKVLDGRPLAFSFQCAADRGFYDDLRKSVTAAGLKAPYFVYQGGSTKDLERLGLDALGDYAVAGSGKGESYASLATEAERRWGKHLDEGRCNVPLVTAGWDRRPRVVHPVPWEAWQRPGEGLDRFYQTPRPEELAAHLERSLRWIERHPEATPARAVLIYAWNEFDEGGWICPTLEGGSARLDAIGKVLKEAVVEGRDRPRSVKAFPTAEGFGADSVGGRGGRVIEVTTLEDSGPGSLRAAMEASGPRICVFRVSGTITLKSAIRVSTPYLTVAGQTSPGGVQIRGNGQPEGDWGVWCVNGAHDIVLRHLRVRMGAGMKHDAGNNILFYGTADPGVHDVIVDHCSVSWGSDTQLDWYGSYLDRATFQWNLIGECFMGQHIGGNRAPKNITLHHNLYANLGSRTPLMQHADVFDFRNNVIYNWSGNNASVFGQFALNTSAFGNVVDNLWIAGPEGGYPYLNVGNGGPVRIDGKPAEAGGTKLYLSGNRGPRSPTGSANDWTGHGVNTWDYYERDHEGSTHPVDQAQYDAGKPFPAPPVRLDPVSDLGDEVLSAVGACRPSRDAVDRRIVQSVRDGTGTSRGDTTGPWPDLASGAPATPVDSDHDGMPDAWERAHGLDPDNAGDGAAIAANGYTNVENYLNELAGDPIPGSDEASVTPPAR